MKIDSRLRHTHVSLFSGIGGIDYAAHLSGFETLAFVEKEPYCQAVLAKNFPGVPIYDDVRTFDIESIRRSGGGIDLLSGGFPCQDISIAGKGVGLEGERSGLWFAMLELIRRGRPRFVLAENVPALYSRGIDIVLGGLEEAGYTAEPFVVAAEDVGAPHRRERIFIVAHSGSAGSSPMLGSKSLQVGQGNPVSERGGEAGLRQTKQLGDSQCSRLHWESRGRAGQEPTDGHLGDEAGLAYAQGVGSGSGRVQVRDGAEIAQPVCCGDCGGVAYADSAGREEHGRGISGGEALPASELHCCVCPGGSEPGVGGADAGFSGGVDGGRELPWLQGWPSGRGEQQKAWEAPRLCERGLKHRAPRLKALGNAVVPWQVLPFLVAISQKLDEEKSSL